MQRRGALLHDRLNFTFWKAFWKRYNLYTDPWMAQPFIRFHDL
jgi:hypothetical protein